MKPPKLKYRILIAVGDNDPIELGTIDVPLKSKPLPNGEPGIELAIDERKQRRAFRRFFRTAARAF